MRWVCILFPDLPLEALAPPQDVPVAVWQQQGNRKLLHIANALADKRGIHPGMGLPNALGLVPELIALERKPEAEAAAIHDAACWAYRFGSPVTLDAARHAVWVEVEKSLKLFGGWSSTARRMKLSDDAPGYRKLWGIAPNLAGAYLMATANAGFRHGILTLDDIVTAIGALPLDLLPLADKAMSILKDAGLRRIEEVLSIPRDALGRRIGKEALLSLDRLLGRAPDAFVSFQPPDHFRRRFEFSDPVETTEALLFPLKMMIGEFCRYLYSRDVSVQDFVLRMIDSRKRVDVHIVSLMSPSREPARLLLILKEKLDRITITDGILEIFLEADRFEEANAIQDDLFGSSVAVGQRFTELTERLAARLGKQAVRQIAVSADLRPEAATVNPGSHAIEGTSHPPRPLWLLPRPRRVVPKRILSTPERIELSWFDGSDAPRDYFMAQDERDRVCWVFKDIDGQYFVHGYWQ